MRSLLHITAALLGLLAFICSPPDGVCADTELSPVSTVISEGVATWPGSVAWSPDGTRLAYIRGGLVIREMGTGTEIKSPVRGVYYLRWLDDSGLLTLREDARRHYASRVDAGGALLTDAELPERADAAYPLKGFGRLMVLNSTMETLRIGVNTSSSALVVNTADSSYREAYRAERIQPRRLIGEEFIMGWTEAGPSPLDDALAMIEYKDPPALHPYVRLIVVDPATWEGKPVYRAPETMLRAGADWSPEGDALAVADREGKLKVIARSGDASTPETDVKGFYPAWSPVADRICFGGHVLSSSGMDILKLRDGAEAARCLWRPGGRDLVLLSGGRLELFTGAGGTEVQVRPGDIAGKLRKVRLLRELYEEGLLERKDYDMRLQRITGIETIEVSR